MESLKEDARELKDIASGEGSLADKAKEASEALKTPGTPDRPTAPGEKGQKPPAEGTETPPAA